MRLPGLILFIRIKKKISSMNTVITVNLTMQQKIFILFYMSSSKRFMCEAPCVRADYPALFFFRLCSKRRVQ